MPTYAPKQESIELISAGTYIARIYRFIELGTHETEYQGKKKRTNKVLFSFELPTELKVFREGEGRKPYAVHARYNLSMFESSFLRQMIESVLGKMLDDNEAYAFDLEQLVGIPCMVNLVHQKATNGKTYVNIKSITPLPKGIECPPAFNPPTVLSFDAWNDDVYATLHDTLKEEIVSSEEYTQKYAELDKELNG